MIKYRKMMERSIRDIGEEDMKEVEDGEVEVAVGVEAVVVEGEEIIIGMVEAAEEEGEVEGEEIIKIENLKSTIETDYTQILLHDVR